MWAIETKQLTKTYGERGGCQGISLQVPRGSIFGLLGPNGAGKSTLVKVLVGLLHKTSGEATILGRPVTDVSARRRVGFLPENFRYHEWLTGEDLLRLHGVLFGLSAREMEERLDKVLNQVGLAEKRKQKVGTYSKGMQQRIGLACALLPDPELLFLDEPTSAMDPVGRKEVRDLLLQWQAEGKTIFLNSHLLSELETICDQIAVIKEGQLLYQGDWRALAKRPKQVRVVMDEAELERARMLGVKMDDVTPVAESLEDLFLAMVAGQ
ncbi:ABC transporter ATP-binding protein [Heliophilum fasciatum]|uniref:ABC-2 type transport system ATP-binding protein n=1 Tax=Heliophilum fasciatum TaxID=35700 RepID=A0A4R2RNW1_9FIRM|nr:ABC transporter ATP-binding protein [Heliophilum fasciatum]MCW2279036.1 ABC-2 type transport system ATP-binding protein [Heliophilum fasciatum]TCP61501.1 ABC-2 type transport system ATP-binding protein [Heliophilum fasciatum]